MTGYPIADTTIVDLVLIFAERLAIGELYENTEKFYNVLKEKGYSRRQLDYAFTLASKRFSLPSVDRAMRIFSREELEFFSPEASSLFLKLNSLGVIDGEQAELVLMRASLIPESQFTEEELKVMVAMMLSRPESELPRGFFVPESNEAIH